MNSFRDLLPQNFLVQMQKELGRDEALRLLWPLIVGSKLGGSTEFRGIRQNTLRVAVPDRTWKITLRSMENMILQAVHRFCGEEVGRAIEFVENPSPANSPPKKKVSARPLPPADLPLDAIADPGLRQIFDRSARKYFHQSRERPALSLPKGERPVRNRQMFAPQTHFGKPEDESR